LTLCYLAHPLSNTPGGRGGGGPGDCGGGKWGASTAVLGDEDAVRDVVAYISAFKPDRAP
ncbi:MAG: hypothetical protein OXP11_06740, partial [Gammaproteobacteria bacterium]|nr:hypothetical protein [Gammaproteobacteria bacterium]